MHPLSLSFLAHQLLASVITQLIEQLMNRLKPFSKQIEQQIYLNTINWWMSVTTKWILAWQSTMGFFKAAWTPNSIWNCSLKIKHVSCLYPWAAILRVLFLSVALPSNTGFNVETVEYKNISFTVWDVGGQDKVWRSITEFCVNILVIWHCFFYLMLLVSCNRWF